MSRRRLLLPLGLAAVAGLLAWRSIPGDGPLRTYAPEDYVARADAFIRAGYLKADCREASPRLALHLDDAPAGEREWYEESYLAADVRRFNQDPGSFGHAFVIDDDCRLRGVSPTVHRIVLPFSNPVRWLGSVVYRGAGSQAQLRSPGRAITLSRPQSAVAARQEATTRVGEEREVVEEGSVLLHYAGGRGQPAARVFPVGDETVVKNLSRRNQPERVNVLGHPLPVGRLAHLESGDWLHLEAESPPRGQKVSETFVYVGGQALGAASRMRLVNDRYTRTTDDPRLGLLPAGPGDEVLYLDAIAGGVEGALAALPEKRARALSEGSEGFDLQLTLDRKAQLALSNAFHDAVAAVQREHPGKPFGAGMTVLDAKSGDLLALATYPWEEDLADLPVADDAERRRLLANQNLRLHPIGSAGKPFFFAAIAHAFPFLMDLVIDPYDPNPAERTLLQCELPKGYRIPEGSGAPVDFRTALQISSNRYTVELGALALAAGTGRMKGTAASEPIPRDPAVAWPRPGKPSGIRLAGRPLDYAPDLGGYVFAEPGVPEEPESAAAERCASLDKFDQVPFRAPLERLTGAATYWGVDPLRLPARSTRTQLERAYRTNRYDLRLLSPLLTHLFAGANEDQQWKIRAATQEFSPERVNLAFNQITRLREDFVTLLLGGGTSLWTNVQLAEAMSRLVTGRAVEARLVHRVLPRKAGQVVPPPPEPRRQPAPEIAARDLRPEARAAVLEGLARVGRPGGTAGAMEAGMQKLRALYPESRIGLYSKTGSPILERPVPASLARALDGLVGKSRLGIEGRTLVVRLQSGNVRHRLPGEPGRAAFREALARALSEVGFRSPSRWLVSYVADLLDEFAGDLKTDGGEETDGPIAAVGGAIRLKRDDRLFRQRLVQGKGGVYLFTLTRRPAGAGDVPTAADFQHSDSRAITVAIFLATGPDSHVAVDVARQVLPALAPLLR